MENVLFIIILFLMGYIVGMLTVRQQLANKAIAAFTDRSKFPVGIVDIVDGQYLLYEKDTVKFLCQADSLEELPKKLLENNISLALIMCPQLTDKTVYWCVNGKLFEVQQS